MNVDSNASGPSAIITDTMADPTRVYAFGRLRILVVSGPDQGLEMISSTEEVAIGTAPSNQLVLTDPTVSRHHCIITASPRGFHLRDLGSTNGTLLSGCRVESIVLRPGIQLRLGSTRLQLDAAEGEIRQPLSEQETFGALQGRSAAMRCIFASLPRIAESEATVLLEGETGTGKGLLADAIHRASPRANGSFVIVDCGSIPPNLIESELFGHMRGAFTGAHANRAGAFESAHGGTVFLDEIGELPLGMQPKLLRVLEDRVVKRIGGTAPISLDVRIIAATNRDLREEVNRGAFRPDLFYRLAVMRIHVPPLRERREDIEMLIHHFYQQFADDPAQPVPEEFVQSFIEHEWPGNVRELRNAIERAVLMHELSPVVTVPGRLDANPDAALLDFDPSLSFRAAKERATGAWERRYLEELLRRSAGNLRGAARAARMDRNHLRELARKLGLLSHDD